MCVKARERATLPRHSHCPPSYGNLFERTLMVELRHVLCPIDFSEASGHALDHATALADWCHADLTAIHVVPPLPLQPPMFVAPAGAGGQGGDAGSVGEPASDRPARERELRAWLSPAVHAGLKIAVEVRDGDPADTILESIRVHQSDLVVMGTHGLRGFDRLVLGSVAETVLRKAGCLVMTVPPNAVAPVRLPYARLLCPVDFSSSSRAALRLAGSLAAACHAQLTALHVADWPDDELPTLLRFDIREFRLEVDARARRELAALVARELPGGVACEEVLHGKPYRQILHAADRDRTDLIVMGVRGRNPVDLALFGSTTNQVVRRAPCPVLSLRQ